MTLNLIIGGGMRCATSSVINNLQTHPEISVLRENQLTLNDKAIGWPFASPALSHYQLGYDPSIYEALAAKAYNPGRKVTVTKQPYFLIFPHIAFGLREQLPDVKLVFILRSQADVVYSAFNKFYKGKNESQATFQDYLPLEYLAAQPPAATGFELPNSRGKWQAEFWKQLADNESPGRLVLERGYYYEHLQRYMRLFAREQILVLKYSDYARNPGETLKEICRFSGIDTGHRFEKAEEVFSQGPKSSPMTPEVRKAFEDCYRDSNARLFELLGWNEF